MTTTLLIARTQEAIRLANVSVYLGLIAIICFGVFGTLASMASFKDSLWIYYAFHYLPYVLIGASLPISLYHVFLLHRYRIIQSGILGIMLATGVGLIVFAIITSLTQGQTPTFFMSVFLAMVAWFAMPYVFRVNLRKFLNFLTDKHQANSQS